MAVEELLELSEAAELLGVHSSTLRRWADSGKVPAIRTLSGRRRFSLAVLEQARKEMQPGMAEREHPSEQFETQTLDIARQRTHSLTGGQANWIAHLNEEHRLLFRYSGQRLLGLMMQFISRADSGEKFLEEGRSMAADYGRICYRAGLTIAQTAEAFLYFRRSILESVQVTAGLGGANDPDSSRIFLRTVDFFDALLVATIESYAQMREV